MILLDAVTKLYGEQKALDTLSLEIPKGQIVGFLGPNGAGKSTTMKIITGVITATSGEASVDGLNVALHPQEVKRIVGYLPENNPLYTEMYVKEYLTYVAKTYRISGKIAQRVAELIELIGLGHEQHKKIGALSKGYRQRVGLAQALIHDPEVLILDEPTSGLDPNQIVDIRSVISEIGKQKTIMLSTHIMQEVEAICDRVMIIKRGKLVTDSPISEISKGEEGRYTVELELDEIILDTHLQAIDGVLKVTKKSKNKWELIAERDVRKDLFNLAITEGRAILTLHQKDRSLEQVFRDLTL